MRNNNSVQTWTSAHEEAQREMTAGRKKTRKE